MEKRSHRRIRDLDVLTAFQGLVANEIGCARISMMAREQETLPAMGRIQMRETNYLQIVTSGLHRTAGPYRCAIWTAPGAISWTLRVAPFDNIPQRAGSDRARPDQASLNRYPTP